MDKAKHTPGPWRIDFDGVLCAPANPKIGREYDLKLAQFPWDSFKEFNQPENKANARLIAAAPDGFDLAKAVVNLSLEMATLEMAIYGPWQDFERVLNQARSLIAKVEGNDDAPKP